MRLPILFIATGLILLVGPASAADLEPGCDCWITEPGTQAELPAIPAGFFGEKNGTPSDAIPAGTVVDLEGLQLPQSVIIENCPEDVEFRVTWTDAHGNPVSPDDIHRVRRQELPPIVAPIDAIVCRPNPEDFPEIGMPVDVEIEFLELSLVSIDPLEVTFGPEPSSFFDVFVIEDGAQFEGVLELTPNSLGPPIGDTLLEGLPVNYLIEFVDVDHILDPQTIDGLSLEFAGTQGSFGVQVTPVEPSTWGTVKDTYK